MKLNGSQIHLVKFWIFILVIIVFEGFLSFSSIEDKHLANMFLILAAIYSANILGFRKYMGRSKHGTNVLIKKYPYLKYWLVFTCLSILPICIYQLLTTSDLDIKIYYTIGAFLPIIGPLFVISEIERFRELS